jgi:hypothetical protein
LASDPPNDLLSCGPHGSERSSNRADRAGLACPTPGVCAEYVPKHAVTIMSAQVTAHSRAVCKTARLYPPAPAFSGRHLLPCDTRRRPTPPGRNPEPAVVRASVAFEYEPPGLVPAAENPKHQSLLGQLHARPGPGYLTLPDDAPLRKRGPVPPASLVATAVYPRATSMQPRPLTVRAS